MGTMTRLRTGLLFCVFASAVLAHCGRREKGQSDEGEQSCRENRVQARHGGGFSKRQGWTEQYRPWPGQSTGSAVVRAPSPPYNGTMLFFKPLVTMPGVKPRVWSCSGCGAQIVTEFDLSEIMGRSVTSTYVNPFGLEFQVMTALRARNTVAVGEVTEAHSWFPGYGWAMLHCADCSAHVGWSYHAMGLEAEPAQFVGLLADSLDQG